MATKVYVLGVTGPRRFSKHRVVAINRVEKSFTDNAADWKQKSDLYYENVLSGNELFLLAKLKYLTERVLAGKKIDPKKLKINKLLVYPERQSAQ